jgi:hypothetical protein
MRSITQRHPPVLQLLTRRTIQLGEKRVPASDTAAVKNNNRKMQYIFGARENLEIKHCFYTRIYEKKILPRHACGVANVAAHDPSVTLFCFAVSKLVCACVSENNIGQSTENSITRGSHALRLAGTCSASWPAIYVTHFLKTSFLQDMFSMSSVMLNDQQPKLRFEASNSTDAASRCIMIHA